VTDKVNANGIIAELAQTLHTEPKKIRTVLSLLEDNTVPFIARYRKEMTGSMDEETLREIHKAYQYQKSLQERKEDVIRLIDEKGLLTAALRDEILAAERMVDVEGIYRPYREQQKTRGKEAEKKGLKPLAARILALPDDFAAEKEASAYVSRDCEDESSALAGAKDIIAERIARDTDFRKYVRTHMHKRGRFVAKKRKNARDEKEKYRMYYDYEEPLRTVKLHRVLALNRAEKEKILSVGVRVDDAPVFTRLETFTGKNPTSPAARYVLEAGTDAYRRLVRPAAERDIRRTLTERAEEEAIKIFSENLKNLLLRPPLKKERIMGIDPAFRTGCKYAIVDAAGNPGKIGTIHPHIGGKSHKEAKKELTHLIGEYDLEVIAIGNGTASRETEAFVADILGTIDNDCRYMIVDEAGASVYSASPLAGREFPDLQVEERSAISIARRMIDPLAELVKIDPRSVGVGQYQHDVDQKKLKEALDFVVSTVVNRVGVHVNTASREILAHVSGISRGLAEKIVSHRDRHKAFDSRKELEEVKGMGPVSFEQSAGFLRIREGSEPFDRTAIHPESYDLAERILMRLGLHKNHLGTRKANKAIQDIDVNTLAKAEDAGLPTVKDILEAVATPLFDPRDEVPAPILKKGILTLEDLEPGMSLQGVVRNVVDFGAFVDCGLKNDGLLHISKMRKGYVAHPMDVVKVGDVVEVFVESIDKERERLSLTMIP